MKSHRFRGGSHAALQSQLRRQVLLKETYSSPPSVLRRLGMIAVSVGVVVERVLCSGVDLDIGALAGFR